MIQEYKVRIGAYTDELKKVVSEAKGEIQKLNDNEILIKFDYDGNLKEYNKLITNLMKAAPELTIQFQYDVNKKLLEQEKQKLEDLETLKLDIDSGQANKKIKDLLKSIHDSYDNVDDFSVIESKVDHLLTYANTLKKMGADISDSFLIDLEELNDDIEDGYGKSIDELLDEYDRGSKTLFKINDSIETTIENTKSNVEYISKLMDKLKSAGAIDLDAGTGEGKGGGNGKGNGEGSSGEERPQEEAGGDNGSTSEERIDDIKKLIDKVETLSADIAEMKQQLSSLSGSAFEEMALSVKKLEEELANTLSQIKELKEAGVSFGGANANASNTSTGSNQTSVSGMVSSQREIDQQEKYINSVWEGLYDKQKKDRDELEKFNESVLERQNSLARKQAADEERYRESILEKQIEANRKLEAAQDKYYESILEKQNAADRKLEAAQDKYYESVLEKQNALARKQAADEEKFRESVLYGQVRKRVADEKREEKRQLSASESVSDLLRQSETYLDKDKYIGQFVNQANELRSILLDLSKQDIINDDELKKSNILFKELTKEALKAENQLVDPTKKIKLLNEIDQYTKKYSGLSKETRASLSQLADSVENIESKSQLKELYNDFVKIQMAARDAGEETQSMFATIGSRITELNAKFIAQFFSWQDIIRYVRELASNVIALNSALTELRKVSNASNDRLAQSFEKSADTALDLGQSIEHVINVTADWSRLGYDVDAAEELARVTALFTTVGDNMTSESASSYLISTLQGYQLASDQAESIVDKYNQVANKFAIDTAGIGEALQRSAASFNAANTDLSKSIALITATNEVIQSPETVGTLWKTLSARIRGAKTELEELGEETDSFTETTSNLRDLVKSLTGFDIMKNENEYKDIYEIILGIGEAWEDLSDIEQASLGEALAGKRNYNALMAVMGNLDTLKDAYKEAEEAAGSAAREQENYAKSVQYSLDRFQASIEKISFDILDSQFLKDIIEGGISILNIFDEVIKKLGGVKASIIALSTYLSVVKREKIIGYLKEVGDTIKFMGGAAATTSSTLVGLKTVLTAIAQNPFSWAVIGGALAVKLFDEFTLSVKEADEKIKDTESDIETLNYEIQKLRDIDSPTNSQKKYLEALEKELSIKERILELDKKDKAEQTYKYTPAEMFDADNEYRKYLLKRTGRENPQLNGGVVYTAHESGLKIATDISLLQQYRTEMEKIDLSTTNGIRKYDEYQKKIDEITRKHSQNLSDVNRDILELQTAIDKAQSDIDNHYLEEGTQAYENAQQIIKSYSRMIEADKSVIDAYERLTSINSSAISSDRVVNPVLGGIKSATDSVMANLEKGNSDLFSSSNLNSYLKTLYDISDALENGTELTKDQLTELRKYFDQLEKRFPQLKDDIVVLNEDFLQGTNVWADAIANVKKELTGLKLDELGDKFEESYSKFSVPETNKSFESAHPNESFIAESKDNLEDAIASSKKYVDELDDIYKHYNGINNISRDLIIWTDENLEKYHDFVAEQGETYEQAADDLRGTWSTVLGAAEDFDGIKIAYTQMLQTDHGLVPLTADQFGAYFDNIFNKAFDENGVFNADKFIQLDSAGSEMVINGQVEHVANMIAAAEGQHMGKIKLTADDVIAIGEPGYDDITGEDLLPGINSIFKGFSMHEVQAEALDARHQLEELAITAEDTGYTLRDILTGIEVEISDDEFKQFESELNSLIESDKDISIAVHADIADNISTISDMFNDINTAAATVQKNFMVSFNDLANLSSIFPGILEGMTILKDGTVQLNKEIAQSAIDAAKAEADADAESAMDRLNTQATLLQAKADTYKEMAHAAAVLAGNEIDSEMTSDDARAKLSAGLAEIEQLNAQLTANEEQKQQKLVADSSQDNGKVVASNWAEAWQEALENAVDFANGAVTAQENAANGEKTGALKVRGSSFSGSSGTSNETNLLAETKSALEETASTAQKVFQDLETRYLEAAAVAEKAAGAARDGIQLIKANRQFTEANLTGVKEGKAGRTTPKTLEEAKEKSSGSDKKDDYKEFIDYFERMIKILDNSVDLLEAHLEDVVGSFAKNTLLDAEEDLIQSKMNGYSSAIDMYSQKASEALSKIPSDIAEKIQNGAVDIDEFIGESNKDVVEAIQEYEKWADKVQDCKLQLVQLKEAIRQLELDKFNNVMQDFTDQFDLRQSAGIDLISKQIVLLQEAGELIGESFYKRQQEQAQKQLQILTNEQEALVKQLNEAISRGVDTGSEEWLSMVNSLTDVEGSILDCKKAIEEFDNAILELHTEIFNRIQDQFSAFASELSNMQELINDDANPVATVKNQWTDEGLAQLGLLAQQYELAKYQVAQYNEEIERLNQLYLQGRYSTTEYADKLIELKNAQWSAVEASESALDSIRSLNQERVNIVVEGINDEIEAYEKYTQAIKDNLSAEKDLHDYQKQIADENKSILDIQRQLAAIQDDDSQAARSRRAKLEEQLKEAQDALAETEYSHSIESQQDALDKQLEQYKETRQAEIDALQESLLNVEQILSDTFEAVRSNSQLIGETILAQAQAHGIEMSQVLTDAWFQGENAIAHYGEVLTSASSNFIGQIQGVEYQVYELQNQANATAEGLAYMFSTRADNLVDELVRSYTSEANLDAMTNALHDSLSNTIDGNYSGASAAAALNSIADAANGVADAANAAASALRSMMDAQNAQPVEEQKEHVTTVYGGPNAGKVAVWTGSGSKKNVIGYRAKGSPGLKHDELSWTQENGPEMIISPSDGAILTPLKRGDAVLPTDQTSNIWEWSRFNPEEFASKLIQTIGNVEGGKVQTNTMQVGSLITVNGNVNDTMEMVQIAANTASAKIKESFNELSNSLNK